MFEQSMLLSPAPGKKAGALAVSLGVQTIAVGTLLLIPLLYTDQLPFMRLELPTFLPTAPPPELPKPEPMPHRRAMPRAWNPLAAPTSIPPLNRQPDIIDNAPGLPDRFDAGSIVALPPILFTQVLPPPPPPQVGKPAADKPITVTSVIQSAKLLRKVIPVYPQFAIMARVSGTVHLIGTIGKDGMIEQLQVVSGPPLLVQAAVDAVRQWVYRPTMLNSKPVEVIAPIEVIFSLSH